MCFSPQADFVAGAVVAGVGVETLRRVRARRELIVGALPLLFGIHQLVEGFVWLGLRGQVSRWAGRRCKGGLHPLRPRSLTGDRPPRVHAARARPATLTRDAGDGPRWALGVYLLWQVTAYPVGAHEEARCIDYTTHTPNDALIGLLYITATCGPALISSRRYLRWFGMVSLVGVIVTAVVRVDELTSLWCVYVAIVSVLILEHFRRNGRPRYARSQARHGPLGSAGSPTGAAGAARGLRRPARVRARPDARQVIGVRLIALTAIGVRWTVAAARGSPPGSSA